MPEPAVSWNEAREYLQNALVTEPKRVVERDQGFDWFPAVLKHSVDAVGTGRYQEDQPDEWIMLRSRINICDTDYDTGIQLAAECNNMFGLGTFIYEDGLLYVQSTYIFGPLNRSLLVHFAVQILAQTRFATRLVEHWTQTSGHAISPRFEDLPHTDTQLGEDELLGFAFRDFDTTFSEDQIEELIDSARSGKVKETFLANWERGFEADDVDFYQNERVAFGIGVHNSAPDFAHYGPGISVIAMSNQRLMNIDIEFANHLNVLIGNHFMCSQFGPVRVLTPEQTGQQTSTANLVANMPAASLLSRMSESGELAASIINFATHTVTAWTQLENYLDDAQNALVNDEVG